MVVVVVVLLLLQLPPLLLAFAVISREITTMAHLEGTADNLHLVVLPDRHCTNLQGANEHQQLLCSRRDHAACRVENCCCCYCLPGASASALKTEVRSSTSSSHWRVR
jgi:hypothetical protein